MNLLAYTASTDGREIILSCSDGKQLVVSDWSNAITFLLAPCDMAVVYDLDDFVRTFALLLPKNLGKKLLEGGRIILPDNTRLFYQPARIFAITYVNEVSFYGLRRYSEAQVNTPCELLKLGQRVIEAYKILGMIPTKLSSPVAVFSEYLSGLDFPRACDLPDNALPMTILASEHMTEEWREVFKLGYWDKGEVSDIDLTASYPSFIAKLPDLSHAEFFESDTMPEYYSFGIMLGDLEVVRNVSPFQDVNGIHFKGVKKDFMITTDALWILAKWGGTFHYKYGWFLKYKYDCDKPFQDTMQHLYNMRDYPDELVSDIAKQISVGIYGMLAQRYDTAKGWKLGENFNSIYAYMVTSRCALYVAHLIYRDKLDDRVINITVDGLLTEGQVDISTQKYFGHWRLNEQTPALVASQLYAWHNDKHPNGKYIDEMIDTIRGIANSAILDGMDLNLLEYSRNFPNRPRTGNDLLNRKFQSCPILL